jgi:hypothetical protein
MKVVRAGTRVDANLALERLADSIVSLLDHNLEFRKFSPLHRLCRTGDLVKSRLRSTCLGCRETAFLSVLLDSDLEWLRETKHSQGSTKRSQQT